MFGDDAVRPRTTPISSAIAASRWLAISSAIASTTGRLQDHPASAVDAAAPSRRDDGSGAVLADDRGTGEPGTLRQVGAAPDRGLVPATAEHDGLSSDRAASRRTRWLVGREANAVAAESEP